MAASSNIILDNNPFYQVASTDPFSARPQEYYEPPADYLPRVSTDLPGELRREFNRSEGGPINFLLEGYNQMVKELSGIISSISVPSKGGQITFQRANLVLPATTNNEPLLPSECRLRNLSYMSELQVSIHRDGVEPVIVSIGKIPVMVRSIACHLNYRDDLAGECDRDPGGYFIMEGYDKVVLMQERLLLNQDVVYIDRDSGRLGNFMICRDGYQTKKVGLVVVESAKKRKINEDDQDVAAPTVRLTTASLSNADPEERKKDPGINVAVIFKIFGFNKEEALHHLAQFLPNDLPNKAVAYATIRSWLLPTFEAGQTDDAYAVLVSRDKEASRIPARERRDEAIQVAMGNLARDLFPHIPASAGVFERINLLSYMLVRLALVATELKDQDDRDNWKVKYLQTPSSMIGMLISQIWRSTMKFVTDKVQQYENNGRIMDLNQVASYLRSESILTQQLVTAIKSGKWGTKSSRAMWIGITEELNRLSETAIWSHLTRINTPSEKRGAQFKARMNKSSQVLRICFAQTPDSEACGLVTNLASTAQVSVDTSEELVWEYIQTIREREPDLLAEDRNDPNLHTHLLLLNGRPRAWCAGVVLRQRLLDLKRSAQINPTTGIILDSGALIIKTTAGRLYSPLLVVDPEGKLVFDLLMEARAAAGIDSRVLPTFQELLRAGAVEYLDTHELENAYIAETLFQYQARQRELEGVMYDLEVIRDKIRLLREQLRQQQTVSNSPISVQTSSSSTTATVPPPDAYELEITQQLQNLGRPHDRLTVLSVIETSLEKHRSAMVKQPMFDYVILDPTSLLGVAAATIPFPQMMQGPRITYQCAQSTQTISVPRINAELRFDGSSKTLMSGQAPLLYTQQAQDLGLDQYPTGRHLIIAICPWGGYNQEDAVIFNLSSIQRGAFRQMLYQTVEAEETDDLGVLTVFYRPPPNHYRTYTQEDPFRFLERDGIVESGVQIKGGDCLVGKARYQKNQQAVMQQYFNQLNAIYGLEDYLREALDVKTPEILQLETAIAENQGYVSDQLVEANRVLNQALLDFTHDRTAPNQAAVTAARAQVQLLQDQHKAYLDNLKFHLEQARLAAADPGKIAYAQGQLQAARAVLATMKAPEDVSIFAHEDEAGVVDSVLITNSEAGPMHRLVKIRIRNQHAPNQGGGGDKFAPRFAQKMTISLTFREEDMPFIGNSGVKPDAMINPTCIPSRMTSSMLLEMVLNKLNAMRGTRSDATAFRPFKETELLGELVKNGFKRNGVETLYNPHTGRRLNAEIMVGPLHYQALKHQVEDKIRVRGEGQYDRATGLPNRGRRNGGGIRFGEMERDCLLTAGVSFSLKDRLSSDSKISVWCRKCGILASSDDHPIRFHCRNCNGNDFGVMEIPGAFDYALQMMGGIGVIPRLTFKDVNLGSYGIARSDKTSADLGFGSVTGEDPSLFRGGVLAPPEDLLSGKSSEEEAGDFLLKMSQLSLNNGVGVNRTNLPVVEPSGGSGSLALPRARAGAIPGSSVNQAFSCAANLDSSAGFSRVAQEATVANWYGAQVTEEAERDFSLFEDDD